MRIKSLTLHGFKSFADRTKIELHEGITAVIGPNGCGKSNISDALRWVLGEQRPTAIRGSRMEEAIFGGTAQRHPIHRAEVALTLTNEDGALALPYSEVVIGRTVYRGGESEYSLNGAPCRLRDVHDLCRDTGLGANAYAVIESRMIDAILSDRAEERRALFEEAAEVGRYKDRRRVALRRLEQAEADLQRLEDVLVEVQSKVRSLAQQRGRAERHTRLKARLLQLEVAVADARLARTEERLVEAEAELIELQRTRPSEEAGLQTAETEAETLRVEQAELERERAQLAHRVEEARREVEERERERLVAQERRTAAAARINALDQELSRLGARRDGVTEQLAAAREAAGEAATAHEHRAEAAAGFRLEMETVEAAARDALATWESARERAESARRELERFVTELDTATDRAREREEELERRRPALDELESEAARLATELEAATGREAELGAREAALEGELEEARVAVTRAEAELRDARERVASLEGELSAARARASGLAALLASSALLPEGVTALLEAGLDGVEGVLAEFIEAPPPWAAAIESNLGAYLNGVVVRDWRVVEAVRGWLEGQSAGGGVIVLPLDPGPLATDGASDGASLLDHVQVQGAGAPWARSLLRAVATRDAGSAIAPAERAWVDASGTGQDRWGAVHLGGAARGEGVLTRRAALSAERERVADLETRLEAARAEVDRAAAMVTGGEGKLERVEAELVELGGALREAAADRGSAEARLRRLKDEREDLSGRIEQLEAFRVSAVEVTETAEERRASLERALVEADEALAAERSRSRKAQEAVEAKRAELHAVELELARSEAALTGRNDALARAEETLRELDERAAAIETERAAQEEVAADSERIATEAEREIGEGIERRSELETALAGLEERISRGREAMEQRESYLREARRAEREHADRRHALELEVTQLKAARASVHERLEAEWDSTLEELRERVEPPDDLARESWETELDEVRRSIARIGPVNLLAQQEYDEEKARLEFLGAQRDDLVGARDDLKDSIRRINRSAAEAFMSTFEQVRENFLRTFQTLFEGGECDLWLEDPADPLDSPIEISASPRGKRTQRIHLLSGGERALTALALLFAIYLAKPSPFCLLDEVDAPLDETNILRFVNMLEQFKADTQFIVITHNPRTIEGADWIYGVTMQEPGVSSMVGVQFDAAPQVA